MKRRPYWCPKQVLWELNSFLMQTLSFFPINLHRCWPREWIHSLGHFTVVCLVPWPLNRSEAGGDLVLLQTLFFICKWSCSRAEHGIAWEYHDLHMKSRKVCKKTRLPPASLLFKGQGTEHTTVKWSIVSESAGTPYLFTTDHVYFDLGDCLHFVLQLFLFLQFVEVFLLSFILGLKSETCQQNEQLRI